MNIGFCPLHQWLPSHLIAILQFILYDKNPQDIGYVKYNNRISECSTGFEHCSLSTYPKARLIWQHQPRWEVCVKKMSREFIAVHSPKCSMVNRHGSWFLAIHLIVILWLCQNSYWKWPSRNRWFMLIYPARKWWIFPLREVFLYQKIWGSLHCVWCGCKIPHEICLMVIPQTTAQTFSRWGTALESNGNIRKTYTWEGEHER